MTRSCPCRTGCAADRGCLLQAQAGPSDAQDPVLALVHRRPASPTPPGPRSQLLRRGRLSSAVAQEMSRAHGGAVTSVYQYALKGFAGHMTAEARPSPCPTTHASPTSSRTRRTGRSPPRLRRPGGSIGSINATCRSTAPTRTTRPAPACTPTSSTPASAPPTGVRRPRRQRLRRVDDGTARTTATAMAPTWRAPIGGTTYGVAKQVKLIAVRVLDCNGSAPRRRHRRYRLGHAQPRLARPWPT